VTDYALAGQDALVQNAADATQVKTARKRARILSAQEGVDWQATLASPAGERVIAAILEQCGHLETPLGKDTHHTYLNIGRAEVGRFILAKLNDHCPDALLSIETQRRAKRRA